MNINIIATQIMVSNTNMFGYNKEQKLHSYSQTPFISVHKLLNNLTKTSSGQLWVDQANASFTFAHNSNNSVHSYQPSFYTYLYSLTQPLVEIMRSLQMRKRPDLIVMRQYILLLNFHRIAYYYSQRRSLRERQYIDIDNNLVGKYFKYFIN